MEAKKSLRSLGNHCILGSDTILRLIMTLSISHQRGFEKTIQMIKILYGSRSQNTVCQILQVQWVCEHKLSIGYSISEKSYSKLAKKDFVGVCVSYSEIVMTGRNGFVII